MHGDFCFGKMYVICHDNFFGQIFFPSTIVHRIYANPFFFTFPFSAMPFHVDFAFKVLRRFQVAKNVICLAEVIEVVQMFWLVFLQIRKKLFEADLR